VITSGDTAADFISALFTGTHSDMTARDQISPIATTRAIPIHMRICIPSRHAELGRIHRIFSGFAT
jgi:hypothetical protein